jgi:hypothetical protein
MKLWLLLALTLTACASSLTRLEDAQTSLETHQKLYLANCCAAKAGNVCTSMSAEQPCVTYGAAVNHLAHLVDAGQAALEGGKMPKSIEVEIRKAEANLEKVAVLR